MDGNGKITKLRRVCPSCGPGVFMASHFDRQYCGKCGLTYMFEGADKKAAPPKEKKAAAEAPADDGKKKKKK